MGNHYANEAGLNRTVPMIICWEEPGLLGSLVCSTAGTHLFLTLSCTQLRSLATLFFSSLAFHWFVLNQGHISPINSHS